MIYMEKMLGTLAHFDGYRLDEIKAANIEAFRAAKLKAGWSGTMANHSIAMLRRILRKGVALELLQRTPFDGGAVKMLPEAKPDLCITPGEWLRYYKAAQAISPNLADVALLMYRHGLRPSEIFGLTPADVDLFTGVVSVRHAKTARGVRRVRLNDETLAVLKRRLADCQRHNGDFLFPGRNGRYIVWNRPLGQVPHRRVAKAAGLKFRLYDLRHSFCSNAIEAGADVLSVQAAMGHSKVATTQRYTHLSDNGVGDVHSRVAQFQQEREKAVVH
jgi:integrase